MPVSKQGTTLSQKMEIKFCLLVLMLCAGLQDCLGNDYTLTLLTDEPEATGAVCLDGTPPGYYMRPGSGDNVNKWVLHLMGGAWCFTTQECYNRSMTFLGSTSVWPENYTFPGILSSDEKINPDLYNWNGIYVIYCDGGSFAGDREDPDEVSNGTYIYYRGYRILQAVIRHLNEVREMSSATDVILTGCSAGGLATLLHADFVGTLLADGVKYRALVDGGYIPNTDEITGQIFWTPGTLLLLQLQNVNESLISACTEDNAGAEIWRCFTASDVYGYVTTPTFVLNSLYDPVVIGAIETSCPPPLCNAGPELVETYGESFAQIIQPVLSSSEENGYFFDSCLVHCQTIEEDRSWSEITINGRTIAQAFGDWYFERTSETRLKDCDTDLPCNPSCPEYEPEDISATVRNIISPFIVLLSLNAVLAFVY